MTMLLDNEFAEPLEEIKLTDFEVFTKIWTSPRKVFRFINESEYRKFMPALLMLAGVANMLDKAFNRNMGDDFGLFGVLMTSVVLGAIFGWVGFYISSALLRWTGKWIKGEASTNQIFGMTAYANIPVIAGLVFWVPLLVVFGNDVFKEFADVPGESIFSMIIFFGSTLIQLGLAIWSLVLLVIGLSQVQNFTIGKALLNILLSTLVILVPIILIGLLVFLAS